jgi:hypothetical protein
MLVQQFSDDAYVFIVTTLIKTRRGVENKTVLTRFS